MPVRVIGTCGCTGVATASADRSAVDDVTL